VKKVSILCVLTALFLTSSIALADTLKGSTGGWQAWVDPDYFTPPYWDGDSYDPLPAPQNIGDYLKRRYGPDMDSWEFWANIGGTADLSLYFEKNSPGQTAAMLLEIAGYKKINEIWWFDWENPSQEEQIFKGIEGPGTIKSFTPTTNWSLYIKTKDGVTYYMDTGKGGGEDYQHFAIFRNTDRDRQYYWIGVEDLPYMSGDKDYQDMVFKLSPAPVPEPTAIFFLGSGLIGLFAFKKRMGKN